MCGRDAVVNRSDFLFFLPLTFPPLAAFFFSSSFFNRVSQQPNARSWSGGAVYGCCGLWRWGEDAGAFSELMQKSGKCSLSPLIPVSSPVNALIQFSILSKTNSEQTLVFLQKEQWVLWLFHSWAFWLILLQWRLLCWLWMGLLGLTLPCAANPVAQNQGLWTQDTKPAFLFFHYLLSFSIFLKFKKLGFSPLLPFFHFIDCTKYVLLNI